ncbi:DUF839 domain-containing protein [Caminibacter mediatlanticus TB-2]|uniref:DUF839 domain-containing protein n=1 Tax=Caminibacter mediatlanticus TB-2 TaxID=391592 RepID=A0ABX5VAD6_9BACT|nr:alkaline phosphatase PhoX [Caminibacter mediatlanticus]QCT93756.1 DUF839 domain-containing protein [Caminibacter mediatlanticus TB-2]
MKKLTLLSGLAAAFIITGCIQNNLSTPSNKTLTDKYTDKDLDVRYPITDAEKRKILHSKMIEINGKKYPLKYKTILKTGQVLNGEIFGLLKDENGNPIRLEDGSYYICNGQYGGSGPDHTEFIEKNGKIFMITQFECGIGAIYQTELKQDKDGELYPVDLKFISQSAYHGGWVHCAGMKTPWNTFLGSEEYEPDARKLDPITGKLKGDEFYNDKAMYFGGDIKKASPYYYGWITEVAIVNKNGADIYTKHYSMGRFAHELAYVLPDRKTAYLSDDGTNCGFFMYKADKAGDLSAGTLYAAKWIQVDDKNGGRAILKWIKLGHATDDEIREIVNEKPLFTDIFDVAKPNGATCPAGFTSINTRTGHECLRVKPKMEKAAAFLETRRYAAIKGATTEFRKAEGITYNPDNHKLYVAISQIAKGMEDNKKYGKPNPKYDLGGNNDIRLPVNKCGGVYALDLDNNYVAKNMYAVITGIPQKYPKNSPYYNKYNKCSINSIANPDNISYLPGSNILLIGEDTASHQIDLVWAFDTKTNKLSHRKATTIYGSETTSVMWQPNINGEMYINFVDQHPYGESDQDKMKSPEDAQSIVGYFHIIKK